MRVPCVDMIGSTLGLEYTAPGTQHVMLLANVEAMLCIQAGSQEI